TYSSAAGRAAVFESRAKECRFHISQSVLKQDLDMMAHAQNSIYKTAIDKK
ncbi:hypothetical protein SK128_013978, partial [Halocaridina rubra]